MRPSFFAPQQVRNLNVNLVRSHAYPPAPWVTAQGVEQYQDNQHPVSYMPQAMGFGKYKTPPAGYGQGMLGQSAVNATNVLQEARKQRRDFHGGATRGVPFRTIHQAANAYNQLPTPDLAMNPQPWSTGVLERPDVIPSTNLMAMAAGIAQNPVSYSQSTYVVPVVGPPRMPDTYRVRRYATRSGY